MSGWDLTRCPGTRLTITNIVPDWVSELSAERFGTLMQGIPTHAEKLDLGRIAESVDLKVLRASTSTELSDALRKTFTEPGPWFIHTRTEPGNQPGTKLLLIDPVVHGDRFRRWLTGRIGQAA